VLTCDHDEDVAFLVSHAKRALRVIRQNVFLALATKFAVLVAAVFGAAPLWLAVVADTEAPTPPCGPCRQLLWEYCGDIDIILGNLDGPTARYRLSALLPLPFDRRLLG